MRKLGVRSAVDLMHLLYEDDSGLA